MGKTLARFDGKPYFRLGDKPFFWLGDTAWLLFSRLSEEEAAQYLQNRRDKGFNVIQADLFHTGKYRYTEKQAPYRSFGVDSEEYWRHCDRIVEKAGELGLFMALLPSWGGLVKDGTLNMGNVTRYADFLAERYGGRENVLWLLGGDIKAEGLEEYYNAFGARLRERCSDRLIGYHPFGRCSSSLWFNDASWLDFHMFQSGHRRYDQVSMGVWDDTANPMSLYGEDNWRYVAHDLGLSGRPTLDGEPSYEDIPQGLHDTTQPRWQAKEVRRYAYWSALAGAAGHTYGHNSIMQFFDARTAEVGAYGAKTSWQEAMDAPGAGQMRYLRQFMESVDFPNGRCADELLIGGQRAKHERVAVFAGKDFVLCYSYLGKAFTLDTGKYIGREIRQMNPATGEYRSLGVVAGERFTYEPGDSEESQDVAIAIL